MGNTVKRECCQVAQLPLLTERCTGQSVKYVLTAAAMLIRGYLACDAKLELKQSTGTVALMQHCAKRNVKAQCHVHACA